MSTLAIINIGICVLLPYISTSVEKTCTPTITRKTTETLKTGDNVVFYCGVVSCITISRVIYEKSDETSAFTPVYQAHNGSSHSSLKAGLGYNLTGRVNHDTVSSAFLFELKGVTVQDNGWWRCVVVDQDETLHQSNPMLITVYRATIKPLRPYLVSSQTETFTCEIKRILEEPQFQWILNGTKYTGNTSYNEEHDDGLRNVKNYVRLDFDTPGKAVLICDLVNLKVETNITVEVKEAAKITDPKKELFIHANGSSHIVMSCSGLGYKPTIQWQRNGFYIRSDNQRYILDDCNLSTCRSNLTLVPIHLPITCDKAVEFTGDYTCSVTSKRPYSSAQTSKSITVGIMHKPILKEPTRTVFITESRPVTLLCEVCSETNITSDRWTFGGEILQGDTVEYNDDGSVTLRGSHSFGAYTRTINNSFGSINCIVYLVNADCPPTMEIHTLFLSVLAALIVYTLLQGFILIIGIQIKRKFKEPLNKALEWLRRIVQLCKQNGEYTYEGLPFVIPNAPQSASYAETIQVEKNTWSIWRLTDSDCVCVGGESSPSITVIKKGSEPTKHELDTGTRIVRGIYIISSFHVINVYDQTSNASVIYCVDLTSGRQLTPKWTLQLPSEPRESREPRCMFKLDDFKIGIYCFRQRLIDVFDVSDISNKTPKYERKVELTGFRGNENDSLCSNPKGDIFVVSYEYPQVYIYSDKGILKNKFNTGIQDPIHIQCFRNNALAVANMFGEIPVFFNSRKSEELTLEGNAMIQAAVFTKSFFLAIDANERTKIHVYRTCVDQD